MARYIDADALIKQIFPIGLVDDGRYALPAKAVKIAIDNAPTADVAPKSEVARLEKLADYQAKDIEVWRQKYEEAAKNLLGLADTASNEMKRAEAEAIIEFAERVKKAMRTGAVGRDKENRTIIDNLVKRMVGDE